ncbi:MAG TPA: hypothetical protein VG994_02725 [Steroidobacteraceae bacterium]|nr:hypothetical protein [Steroidobacteraceae bacterium]
MRETPASKPIVSSLATAVERAADQLSTETYARQCHHDACPDVQYRRGHNDATLRAVLLLRALLAQHRLNVALAELRAHDVDALFDQTEAP